MRRRTTAAKCGAWLTLVTSALGACGGGDDTTDTTGGTTSAVPGEVTQQDERPLRLIVGDTFRLDLNVPDTLQRVMRAPRTAPRVESDSPDVATVSDGLITARRIGRTNITVSGAEFRETTFAVEVMTRRRATNLTLMEVCPNEARAMILASEPMSDSVETIHEYHDCQRLIEGGTYRGLVGIFAHVNVAKYDLASEWEQGRLAAIIVNFDAKGRSWPYPSLGIRPGVNCLVLKWDAQASEWRAAVSSRGDFTPCNEAITWNTLPAGAKMLNVKPQTGVDMNGQPVAPPVARWDWDTTAKRNYIGVKCGARTWCEIGEGNFTPSAPIRLGELLGPPDPPNANADVIKGYYDQQYLANATAANPSTVFGTISPGEDAKQRDDMADELADLFKWQETARLRFKETAATQSQDYRRYARNYQKRPTPPPNERETTARYELKLRFVVPEAEKYRGRFHDQELADDGVVRTRHVGILHHGPPVVRWRWHATDELTWSYCHPDGCCENVKVLMQ